MAEPDEIAARIAQLLAPGTLAGRRVLVTAGGTREAVDAVRFVGNRSSGRMGVALAEEARRRGADVVLLAANLAVDAAGRSRGRSRPRPPRSMLEAADGDRLSTSPCSRRQSPTTGRPSRSSQSARRAASRGRSSSSRPPTSRGSSASASCAGQVLVDLRRRPGRGRPRAQASHARREERRPRRLQRRLPRRHRLRRDRQRGRPRHPRRRAAIWPRPRSSRSPRRSSTRRRSSCPSSRLDERRVRATSRRAAGGSRRACPPRRRSRSRRRRRLEPAKASIREALGIAYFRLSRWQEAEAEFRAVLELSPTDDYAHYALGRALEKQGREAEANGHYKLASTMVPGSAPVRGTHPRARVDRLRAVVQRVARARVTAVDAVGGGEIGAGLCVLLGVAHDRRRGRRRAPRRQGRAAARSSKATTAGSTARCSTRAARRSSSRSSP